MSRALVPLKPPARPDLEQGDFAVSIKVRNGRFLGALKRRGYRSVLAFCKAHGLPYSDVARFATMTLSPVRSRTYRGQPTALAQTVADILETHVEDLFPPQFYSRCLTRVARADDVAMTEDQIGMLLQQPPRTPEDVIAFDEAARDISNTLILLPPRVERVLRLRHGMGVKEEETFEQVGGRLDVSRERVRQMEQKGFRMLTHPSRNRYLRQAAATLGVGIFRMTVPARPRPTAEMAASAGIRELSQAEQRRAVARPKPKPPPPEPLRRKIKFPPVLGEPAYIVLLRKPPSLRDDEHKRALAFELERELVRRGASPMRPSDDLTRAWLAKQDTAKIELAKYQWLMKNLADLWEAFPPAPRL